MRSCLTLKPTHGASGPRLPAAPSKHDGSASRGLRSESGSRSGSTDSSHGGGASLELAGSGSDVSGPEGDLLFAGIKACYTSLFAGCITTYYTYQFENRNKIDHTTYNGNRHGDGDVRPA